MSSQRQDKHGGLTYPVDQSLLGITEKGDGESTGEDKSDISGSWSAGRYTNMSVRFSPQTLNKNITQTELAGQQLNKELKGEEGREGEETLEGRTKTLHDQRKEEQERTGSPKRKGGHSNGEQEEEEVGSEAKKRGKEEEESRVEALLLDTQGEKEKGQEEEEKKEKEEEKEKEKETQKVEESSTGFGTISEFEPFLSEIIDPKPGYLPQEKINFMEFSRAVDRYSEFIQSMGTTPTNDEDIDDDILKYEHD
jgi:hypothetical protein